MTRAVHRMRARTGAGSSAPPARCAPPAVRDLIGSHRLKYGTAARIARPAVAPDAREMALDLALGLGHEAETDAIAQQRRGRADRKRAGIPERVQQARARAELAQARLAPGQMVGSSCAAARSRTRACAAERDAAAWP